MTHFFNPLCRRSLGNTPYIMKVSLPTVYIPDTLFMWDYMGRSFHSKLFSNMAPKVDQIEDIEETSMSTNAETLPRISPNTWKEAQSALLDYLHNTRSLPFLDAEHMSRNSPKFLKKLIENAMFETDISRSVARFLRYHPINEFEPFFESIGLDPSEFLPLLPRDSMFLSDESRLLDNYFVLCQYGVPRRNVGKIYRMAREMFHDCNVDLMAKLRDFEEVGMSFGISKPVIAKAVCFDPCRLIDGMSVEFFKVVGKLQCLDFKYNRIEKNLSENASYNWRQIFESLNVLSDMVCNNLEFGNLVRQHPELLFDRSGQSTFTLIGFSVKLGCSKTEISSLLLQFPQVKVGKFVGNISRAFELFNEIEMDNESIGSIFRNHLILLGSCSVKKALSVLHDLNIGKRQLCGLIRENPLVLKNWVLGAKIERLPRNRLHSRNCKIMFLSRIGLSENSKEMERALKLIRGSGVGLQERYDCLVKAGLSEEDVVLMIKRAPQILNQSKEVIEAKIKYLVGDLGYPVSTLTGFPKFLSYTLERLKLRCSMYKWLLNQNNFRSSLALSTVISCTESDFLKTYVNKHPGSCDVWQELKKTYSV